MHDLGKIETPIEVLRKPGALTDEEYEVMKRHAADGARMASALNDPDLTAMVMHHHERLDGTGYPAGLQADEIPLGARIIAVADTFDAMTADRPYRAARAHKQALDVLRGEAGTKLDGDAVRAFCSNYSGRRSIAVWSSLTTIPSRLASMLSSSAGGVAATVKAVAVAAIVGNFASGAAAGLARPASHGHEKSDVHLDSSRVAGAIDASTGPASAAVGGSGSAALHPRSGSTTSTARGAGSADSAAHGSAQTNVAGQGPGAPEAAAGASSEGAAPSSPEGAPVRHGEETRDSGGEHGGQPVQTTKPETPAKTSEPIRTTVQETAGKVNEVAGKVTGKVEETTTKVSEVAGKVTGKVEEVKSKAEETTKETIKETTNKVGEVIKKL
jgi:uncharacterized protein YjbJ (UPF0337 family)